MTTVLPGPEVNALVTGNTRLIGGEWVPASSGETIDVIDPATGGVATQVPRGRAEDVDAEVSAAAASFPAWHDTGFGRTMGADVVLDHTQVKAVSLRGTN